MHFPSFVRWLVVCQGSPLHRGNLTGSFGSLALCWVNTEVSGIGGTKRRQRRRRVEGIRLQRATGREQPGAISGVRALCILCFPLGKQREASKKQQPRRSTRRTVECLIIKKSGGFVQSGPTLRDKWIFPRERDQFSTSPIFRDLSPR